MEAVSDWAGLIPDVLLQIASKVTVLEDFMALRGVCTPWRAVITRDKFACVSKIPLLMLSEKQGNGSDNVREFYSLRKRKVCMRMSFPEAKGKRLLDAGFGWTLIAPGPAIHCTNRQLNLVRLRPPTLYSSHPKIQLPTFLGCDCIYRAVLSANPSETSDFVLVVCADHSVVFWKNGDRRWTMVRHFHPLSFPTVCYHKQRFHVLDPIKLTVYAWDPSATSHLTIAEVVSFRADFFPLQRRPYLVVSNKGELLLIMRYKSFENPANDPFGAPYFCVVQIDVEKRVCKQIYSLDGCALFIGPNSAVSVVAQDFPELIKPNHIYFTDDYTQAFTPIIKGGMDMGIYNIQDCSIQRFDVKSYSFVCPPVWIFPS